MKLRPYQHRAYEAVLAAEARGVRKPLVVMATGLGKTVLFSHLADYYRGKGRVMVLAHRRELIAQAAEKLAAVTGVEPATEMGDQRAASFFDRKPPIVVSSIQTHDSRQSGGKARRENFDPAGFSLVIFDEAHRAAAVSWRRTVQHYSANQDAMLLFVTATPQRLDGAGVADEMVFSYGIRDGIRDGWLVDIDHMLCHVKDLDFSRCKVQGGDYVESDLAKAMEEDKPLLEMAGVVADEVAGGDIRNPKWHLGRPGIVFMPSVDSAREFCGILNRQGYIPGRAGVVWGAQPEEERARIVEAFRSRQLHVLVNCGVFLEGFDAARIAFVVPRPTLSRTLYEQMIGRGTRPLPGIVDAHPDDADARLAGIAMSHKPTLKVLDFCGVGQKHRLVTALDVLSPPDASEEVVDLAYQRSKEGGRSRPVQETLEDAQRELTERQEAAKRKEAERNRRLERRKHMAPTAKAEFQRIDPFGAGSADAPVERRVGTATYWIRPTEKQLAFARNLRIPFDEATIRRGPLSAMIDEEMSRRKRGLAWASDIEALAKVGIDAKDMTRKQALRAMVDHRRASFEQGEVRPLDSPVAAS